MLNIHSNEQYKYELFIIDLCAHFEINLVHRLTKKPRKRV